MCHGRLSRSGANDSLNNAWPACRNGHGADAPLGQRLDDGRGPAAVGAVGRRGAVGDGLVRQAPVGRGAHGLAHGDGVGPGKEARDQGKALGRRRVGDEVVVGELQAVQTTSRGGLSETLDIPAAPMPTAPPNNVGFDAGRRQVIELAWRGRPSGGLIHLQVSRSKSFDSAQLEVDAPRLAKDEARLRLVAAGTYFWRIAALGEGTAPSEWSAVRRFRVFSTASGHLLEDTTPPELIVNQPQQLGHMFIFEGATEVSATVTINGEKVELDADGRFRKTVEIFDDGWIDIVIVAVDPSGNRTERTERVFVEVY